MIVFLMLAWAADSGDALARAQAAYGRTEYAAALEILKAVRPPDAPTLELSGKAVFGLGDYKRAVELFEQAIQKEPRRASAYHWLGRAYGRRAETSSVFTAPGHASKARQNFEKAVELDGTNKEALNDLFEYYLQAPGFLGGGVEKAKGLLERIGRLDPAERSYAEARLAEDRKDLAAMERFLRQAVERAPRESGRWLDLGRFLARRGRWMEAEEAFAKAGQLSPGAPKVWLAQAEAYVEAGVRLAEAKPLLERYLRAPLTPEDRPREEVRRMLAKLPARP